MTPDQARDAANQINGLLTAGCHWQALARAIPLRNRLRSSVAANPDLLPNLQNAEKAVADLRAAGYHELTAPLLAVGGLVVFLLVVLALQWTHARSSPRLEAQDNMDLVAQVRQLAREVNALRASPPAPPAQPAATSSSSATASEEAALKEAALREAALRDAALVTARSELLRQTEALKAAETARALEEKKRSEAETAAQKAKKDLARATAGAQCTHSSPTVYAYPVYTTPYHLPPTQPQQQSPAQAPTQAQSLQPLPAQQAIDSSPPQQQPQQDRFSNSYVPRSLQTWNAGGPSLLPNGQPVTGPFYRQW